MIDIAYVQIGIFSIYLLSIVSICLIKFYKPLNNLLLYGKSIELKHYTNFTEFLVRLTVPKQWFSHYYYSLVLYCVVFQYVDLSRYFTVSTLSSPSIYQQLKLVQYCLTIQGIRRSGESLLITKYGTTSRINICHYLLGMIHYFIISLHTAVSLTQCQPQTVSLSYFEIVLLASFVVVSIVQFLNHYHLASLVKYSIPKFWLVSNSHYLNEIEIYFILMMIVCKQTTSNWLIPLNYVICLVFVATNLSISSIETHKYYQEKFPKEFKFTYSIIPGVI